VKLDTNVKMTNNSPRQGYAYSYSYEGGQECDPRPGYPSPLSSSRTRGSSETDMFTLKLHCPGLASLRWMVKLYSLVLGGLGVILSFTWVCFHLYVLSMTSLMELRQHRYLDICLGIILLVSMLCLLYGTYSQSPHFLILFFILSLVVVIGYWTWYVYVNFVSQDSPVFEDQIGKIGLILTFLFCFLLVPIMMLYRHTELQGDSVITPSLAGARRALRGINSSKFPPKYEDSFEHH